MPPQKVSLYIHIPFCSVLCDYCDFYSVDAGKARGILMDKFIKALIEDIRYQLKYFNINEIITAYIGGGTPSVLGARRIRVLLDGLKSIPGFKPVEFTIEANPESADEEFLSACIDCGINRISLGIQSFHEPSRRAVNRIGNAGMLEKSLSLVSRFFPGAFSADLITGFPYHNESIVLEDINRLLAFKPAHISLYSLSVEKGTLLQENIKSRKVKLPLADEADALWLAGKDALEKAGYEHYEVSNFSLPGKRCLHNMRYWLMNNWLGAGPAASGTIIDENTGTAKRFSFAPDLEEYIKMPSLNMAVREELDKVSLIKESLLMGFRCREGPDREKFKRRFGISIEECIPQTLARWKKRDADYTMLFLNGFLSEVFAEIEKKN